MNPLRAIISALAQLMTDPFRRSNNRGFDAMTPKPDARLPQAIVSVAAKEIGVEEVNGTNCGPRVNEYKAATWLDPKQSWPWCAAFVCWVVKEALRWTGTQETDTFKRPKTAGAWDFENWSRKQDRSTWTRRDFGNDVAPGDVVIFKFSHIGIAASSPDKSGYIATIEGNTDAAGSREGGGVFKKRRHLSKIKATIRFRV